MQLKKLSPILLFFLLAFVSSGCDAVSYIKESFSKKEKKEVVTEAQGSKVDQNEAMAPAVTQLQQNEIVRINQWSMTAEQFEERIVAFKEAFPDFDETTVENKALLLDELIRQQLIVEDAEQTGLANDPDIKSAVDEFRRSLIVQQKAAEITNEVEVTDEEIQQFYEENKAEIISPVEIRVSEIVADSEDQAKQLLAQILQGADFAEIARQHSISATATKGGDLGFIEEPPFPEFVTAVVPLEVGGVSSVFKGPLGFYIIKLEDQRGGEEIPLEDIQEELTQNLLFTKQQEALIDYVNGLQDKYDVQINEEFLNN